MKRSAKSRPKQPELGKTLIKGLKEARMRGEIQLRTRVVYIPEEIDVQAVREKSCLSQAQFAERYGFNPRTLQDWEQGRTRPDSAVRAYLTVIDRDPEAVQKALWD